MISRKLLRERQRSILDAAKLLDRREARLKEERRRLDARQARLDAKLRELPGFKAPSAPGKASPEAFRDGVQSALSRYNGHNGLPAALEGAQDDGPLN